MPVAGPPFLPPRMHIAQPLSRVLSVTQNILVAYIGMTMADYSFTWPNFAGINIR